MSLWSPPPQGWLKLNVDAYFNTTGAGFGFILRDHRGSLVSSGAGPLPGATAAEHAEAMAIWCSLELTRESQDDRILIETDCLHLVHRLRTAKLGG